MLRSKTLKVVGIDPSLRNWGLAIGSLDRSTFELNIYQLQVVQPIIATGKQVRQNSKDLESASQLTAGTIAALQGAQAVFVECPVGSQSARAMASYGVCVGILGALRAIGHPFFEVTASQVKLAAGQSKTASKKEMIQWATTRHPEAAWPTYVEKGVTHISEAKAEHMADAVAAIHAGLNLSEFKQLLRLAA